MVAWEVRIVADETPAIVHGRLDYFTSDSGTVPILAIVLPVVVGLAAPAGWPVRRRRHRSLLLG